MWWASYFYWQVIAGCFSPEAASKFKDALADFQAVNAKPWLLQRRLQIEKPYEHMNWEAHQLVFKQGGWENFKKQYPGSLGIISLFAVGFSQDKTRAVVYSGSLCGSLCGSWDFHLMEKIDGKWMEQPGVTCHTVS